MRRRMLLPLLLLLILPLGGCWNRVEINDLAVVAMMAIDQTDEGRLRLWVHLVIPSKAGGVPGTGGQASGAAFITLSATGRSIMEAAQQIQLESSRRLFWAHARVVLIGERLAQESLRPVVDFLTRHRELRPTNYVLVVRGDVAQLMGSPVNLERLPVEKIREISRARVGTAVEMGEWVEMLYEKGSQPVMGVVELKLPPDGAPRDQNPSLALVGTALFRSTKLVGYLDDRVTRGLLWLRAQSHRGSAAVEMEGETGVVSLSWNTTTVERKARLVRGQVEIEVLARVEGDISEETVTLDLSDPQVLRQIETQLNQQIIARMEAALSQMKRLNVDAAGLGEVVHRQLPVVWRRLERNWLTEGFQEARVILRADARIRRTGLSTKPRGVREEELIKGGR